MHYHHSANNSALKCCGGTGIIRCQGDESCSGMQVHGESSSIELNNSDTHETKVELIFIPDKALIERQNELAKHKIP